MNPVFQEAISTHFTEGRAFRAYFVSLLALASIQCLLLFLNQFDPHAGMARATLFDLSSVFGAILAIYLGLKVGNQEFHRAPRPPGFWFRQKGLRLGEVAWGQIGFLALHSFVFAAVAFPLLFWPAAIARAGGQAVQRTLLLMLFYSLVYGMWGLVASASWHSLEGRQFFTRCLFAFFVVLSGLVHLSLNPAAYLLFHQGWMELGKPASLLGFVWSPAELHFMVHFFLLAAALLAYLRALKREA